MSETLGRLAGKVAVVTGGASGIGRAVCEAFHREGAVVHVLDVDGEAAASAARELDPTGARAIAHACDVGAEADVERAFSDVAARGPVDLLVNNAGVVHIGDVESTTPDDMDRLYRVNVKGVYLCTRAAVRSMKERGGGVIVNLASIAGQAGLARRFAYSMTKGAVLAMTLSTARDYADHGIRCVSISPARVHTSMVDRYLAEHYAGRESEMFEALSRTQPIGRMGKPEEVAALAVWLCSDEAAFATGVDYPLDGGFLRLHG